MYFGSKRKIVQAIQGSFDLDKPFKFDFFGGFSKTLELFKTAKPFILRGLLDVAEVVVEVYVDVGGELPSFQRVLLDLDEKLRLDDVDVIGLGYRRQRLDRHLDEKLSEKSLKLTSNSVKSTLFHF